MKNKLQKTIILMIFVSLLFMFAVAHLVIAYLSKKEALKKDFTIGEVILNFSSSPEANIDLLLTSPTFLLDPIQNDDLVSQFNASCEKIVVTIINDGNVNAVVGYGNNVESSGITIDLINDSINYNNLAGIVFVALPHSEGLNYHEYIYSQFEDKVYVNFTSLQSALALITVATINNIKSLSLEPSEQIQFDIFIWQEYFDGDNYSSQYEERYSQDIIFRKQDFSLKVKVYFGQEHISH